LSSAVREVADIIGQDGAQRISADNPGAVLEGRPIPWRPLAAPPVKKRKWLFF
jgi:hypothetical protein